MSMVGGLVLLHLPGSAADGSVWLWGLEQERASRDHLDFSQGRITYNWTFLYKGFHAAFTDTDVTG